MMVMVKTGNIKEREVQYYEVLPKKVEGVETVTEVGVTIQATPNDASIFLDDKPFSNNVTTKLFLGIHKLRVEKAGYTPYIQDISVTPEKTLFQVNLSVNDPVSVIINSNSSDADIQIDGMNKGKTKKALFMFPGSYELRLSLSGYLPISEKVTVSLDEKLNNFTYNLTKNTGKLRIDVTPAFATVRINKEAVNSNELQELAPGTYQAESSTYYSYKGTVEIELGKTKTEKITLTQKLGKLQFAINPPEAESILSQNGIEKHRWTGLKIISTIAEGSYDLTAKCSGYKSYKQSINIKEGQTTIEDIQMVKGSDGPKGMVLVEGKTFSEGSNSWSSFYIAKTEITQEQWESVMGNNPSSFKGAKRPVENVSWNDVILFCNKISEKEGLTPAYSGSGSSTRCNFKANGYRLPTEAEWEYAAKGGNKSKGYEYSGSDNLEEVGWYSSNSGSETHNVGTKLANELGLFDMSGNVWEWCWDEYSGSNRRLRGGSWVGGAGYCRSARRSSNRPDSRYDDIGARVLRTK
jgi:formylglycine-generating enzyme required for sulfatase activity